MTTRRSYRIDQGLGGSSHMCDGLPRSFVHIGQAVSEVLRCHGVTFKAMDRCTVVFNQVPLAEGFNKPATNVLVAQRNRGRASIVMVDEDLKHERGNAIVVGNLLRHGPCRRRWRQLQIDDLVGVTAGEVLLQLLERLGSPCIDELADALRQDAGAEADDDEPLPGTTLTRASVLTVDEAASAYQGCIRKTQADQLASIVARSHPPHAALVIGPSGSGKGVLMKAAAHVAMERGLVKRVYCVESAPLVAGGMMETDRDAALMGLFREMEERTDSLFLIDHIDLMMATLISHSLLAGALDKGVRFFATFKVPSVSIRRVGADDDLRRRLTALYLADPHPAELLEALNRLAGESGMKVEPAAARAAIRLSSRLDHAQPSAAMSLLGNAINAVSWRGGRCVSPDDVTAAAQEQCDWGANET